MNFDRDYWRISSRQALEALLSIDQNNEIKIYGNFAHEILALFNGEDRRRLRFTDKEDAHYYIECYRKIRGNTAEGKEIYTIKVGNIKICSILKLK